MNIYPGQIDEVLSSIPEVGSEYQLHLERNDGRDYMTIKVEVRQGLDSANTDDIKNKIKNKIRKTVQSKIMVSCDTHLCAYGELPRFEGKAQRIFDKRS